MYHVIANITWVYWRQWRQCSVVMINLVLMPLVEQELLPFRGPDYPRFLLGSCYLIFSFMSMFCRSLFVFLSFFVWPLCFLSFDLRILITSLWYLQTLLLNKAMCPTWSTTDSVWKIKFRFSDYLSQALQKPQIKHNQINNRNLTSAPSGAGTV